MSMRHVVQRIGLPIAYAGVLLFLVGCQTLAPKPLAATILWQDQAFHYQAGLVVETQESVFALDASLLSRLNLAQSLTLNTSRRLEFLMAQVYGPDGINLEYRLGHSTGAAQTWQSRRGDCLSLTLLTYAIAKKLHIPAQMQEVAVPPIINRRSGIDFQIGHVNLFVPNPPPSRFNDHTVDNGGIIIDFEPQVGSRQRGLSLSETDMLARFYNNRATEYLTAKQDDMAYAYFKAAILTAPQFSAPYSNLAQLYLGHGFSAPAEGLLRHALALNDNTDAPLRTLLKLLRAQGRESEALPIAAILAKHQDESPYYWLALGLDAMKNEQYQPAIKALQRAESLTSGFAEIHRYLAFAYWRNRQAKEAMQQLALLKQHDLLDPGIALLQRKMAGADLPP